MPTPTPTPAVMAAHAITSADLVPFYFVMALLLCLGMIWVAYALIIKPFLRG